MVVMTLVGINSYAQSTDQAALPITTEQTRMEATIICLDAIEAPTKYNAFVKQFIDIPSFPKKTTNSSQNNYKKEIDAWLVTNPTLVNEILIERKKAHDILYGPRPH